MVENALELFKGIDDLDRKPLQELYSLVISKGEVAWEELPKPLRVYLKAKDIKEDIITMETFAKILQKVVGSEDIYIFDVRNQSKVPESSELELQKEAISIGSEVRNHGNFLEPARNARNSEIEKSSELSPFEEIYDTKGDDNNQLYNTLKEKYNLERQSDSLVLILFVEYNNSPMTKNGIIKLLTEKGVKLGTAKRAVTTLIGKDKPNRSDLLIVHSQDPISDEFYYVLQEEVYKEIKAIVDEFLAKKKRELEEEEYERELQDDYLERAVEYLRLVKKDDIAMLLTEIPEMFVVVDLNNLNAYDSELAYYVLDEPEKGLELFNEALQIVLEEEFFGKGADKLRVTFKNVGEPVRVRDLSASQFGKLVAVRAIISGTTSKKKQVYLKATFICRDCGNVMKLLQDPIAKPEVPKRCEKCGSKNIRIKPELSETADIEFFTLQDIPDDLKSNEQPQKVHAYVVGDFPAVYPGDRVLVTGILKDTVLRDRAHIADFVIEILHVELLEPRQIEQITDNDLRELYALKEKYGDELPKAVARSIAPGIVGWEDVKLGVALAIASKKDFAKDKTRLWSHVLLLGDRGVGKSEIITDAKEIVRGVLVTAGTESKVGLTATVERDELSKEWMFKAGAIVRANKGVLFIDEGDKIPKDDLAALHAPMSRGRLSLTKASIVAELNAFASVVMASNPIGGKVLDSKPIFDQIPFPVTLLDRFDLIFVMRLRKDLDFIKRVAEHKKRGLREGVKREIDEETLRKLFRYAQIKEIEWTNEALDEVEKFFIDVNVALANASKFSYSTRLWGIIVRLSEAHARLRLSDKVELKDVKEAERLIISSIKSWGAQGNEEGVDDVDWTLLAELEKRASSALEDDVLTTIEEAFKSLHELLGERIAENFVIDYLQEKAKWDLKTIKENLKKAKEVGLVYEKDGYWYLNVKE